MQTLFTNSWGYIKTSVNFGELIGQFNGVNFNLHYTSFYLLHKKLNAFDIALMLNDLSKKADNNLILLQQGKCKINCNLQQLIALKNLFNGAMFYIRLQDELYKNSINTSELCEQKMHNFITA